MDDLPSWTVDFAAPLDTSMVDIHQMTYQNVVGKEPEKDIDSIASVEHDKKTPECARCAA
jgi:hypothetical protein